MARLIEIPTHSDSRGNLSVIDSLLPFEIKRVYYIYDSTAPRGGHGHKYSSTFLVPLSGTVKINVVTNEKEFLYEMTSPSQGLLLQPGDWLTFECEKNATLLCLSSHPYNLDDYIY